MSTPRKLNRPKIEKIRCSLPFGLVYYGVVSLGSRVFLKMCTRQPRQIGGDRGRELQWHLNRESLNGLGSELVARARQTGSSYECPTPKGNRSFPIADMHVDGKFSGAASDRVVNKSSDLGTRNSVKFSRLMDNGCYIVS
jgi:hypothetical protein